MTRDNRLAICRIALENGLVFRNGYFYDENGAKYAITPLGLTPNINHNYAVLYRQVYKDVDYQRALVKRLKEENERLKQDMIHRKSRKAILSILDGGKPERVINRLKQYLCE